MKTSKPFPMMPRILFYHRIYVIENGDCKTEVLRKTLSHASQPTEYDLRTFHFRLTSFPYYLLKRKIVDYCLSSQ